MSAAEVVVCWAVLGVFVEALLKQHVRALSSIGATLVASLRFGIYHFAHSAPFNTVGMVALLSAVGVITRAFAGGRGDEGGRGGLGSLGVYRVVVYCIMYFIAGLAMRKALNSAVDPEPSAFQSDGHTVEIPLQK